MFFPIKDNIKKLSQLVRYCIVGSSGALIDLASLYIFVEYFQIYVLYAAVLSFLLSVTNNFILNKYWTFKNRSRNFRKLYVKYLMVSTIGLGLTIGCMYVLLTITGLWYMFAKAITSLIVVSWNFLANKFWTFRTSEQIMSALDEYLCELSVIIPAYNEEKRIKKTVEFTLQFLNEQKIEHEIIVVDDGSTDQTKQVIEGVRKNTGNIRFIELEKNCGKGCAVKKGVESSNGRYILFTDADNSTPIEEFIKLFKKMRDSKANIAIGSRYLQESDVQIRQPGYRIFIGRMCNFLIRLFVITGFQDTQCGFKLFEHEAAKTVFSYQKVKRFAFDIEILVIAKNKGYKVVEVPVSWLNSLESRVRPFKDSLRTLRDLVYIKLNLWSGRYTGD